jgi:exosortase D (VPLPA-CTERM-specific)
MATADRDIGTPPRYRSPLILWALVALALAGVLFVAREGFALVMSAWLTRAEYSHGILIPLIVGFLIWQRRDELAVSEFSGSWLGLAVVIAGLFLWLAGNLSTIYAVSQYALIVMILGLVLSLVGLHVFRKIAIPLLMLFFTVPLPAFIYNNLSSDLQLISSSLGVAFIRACGISVYLSGNVIDLGHFQMQVVEACDGLRYLFPLMALGFIVAYFFKAPLWQRAIVFLASIPVTIFMNSLRIAMIGVFAEFGNTALAEGLLHELQGWVIFMASAALLLALAWLLARIFMRGKAWNEVFAFDFGAPPKPATPTSPRRRVPATLITSAAALLAATVASLTLPQRAEAYPSRAWFVDFPMDIVDANGGDWHGRQGRIEDIYLDALKLDDYLMADYTDGTHVINLYSAYYKSQRQGASIHSPRSCIPGGGWRITELNHVDIAGTPHSAGFRVNRALIELGSDRQLVYYWFKQRERLVTNEYAAKWFIFVDALTRSRTDGALIRLVTPLPRDGSVADADARLAAFAGRVEKEIGPYVPD